MGDDGSIGSYLLFFSDVVVVLSLTEKSYGRSIKRQLEVNPVTFGDYFLNGRFLKPDKTKKFYQLFSKTLTTSMERWLDRQTKFNTVDIIKEKVVGGLSEKELIQIS